MSAIVIEQLMEALMVNGNKLKKFALVKVNHSERSFESVIAFLRDYSTYLQELDLSW